MVQNNLYKKDLSLACDTQAPHGPKFIDMTDEIKILQEYLGKKFNNLEISKELKYKVDDINFFECDGFEDWLKKRGDFYESERDKLIKNEEEVISGYIFLSETFKILDKCSWWVQNAYQPSSNPKTLLGELDNNAIRLENEDENNKNILVKKAKSFCNKECKIHIKSTKDCNREQREKERQIFAFFAEIKVAKELDNSKFVKIRFIPEQQNIKTPDLSAEKENKVYYIEVKRIQKPRTEDEALRSTGQYNGYVNREFQEPLKKKIGDFICDTKEKFKGIKNGNVEIDKEQKILVIDFAPGTDARLNDNFSNSNLELVFGKDYFSDLEETHNMQIWTRKFF